LAQELSGCPGPQLALPAEGQAKAVPGPPWPEGTAMAKSIRSKIKKRLRTAKRQRVDAMLVTPQAKEHHEALQRTIQGRSITFSRPKNAFKHPKAEDAVFPQHEVVKPIDFRSSHLPMAGFAFRGNRRKYEGEQAEMMANLAKTSHPEMEVLAGGGAVLATTGQRVAVKEAELVATRVNRPAAAAVAASPPSASSAVAAATAEAPAPEAAAPGDAEMDDDEASNAGPEPAGPEPDGQADHTRRPVLKDDRRAKRTAAHRPRANAAKKEKGKVHVEAQPAPAAKKKGGKKKPAEHAQAMAT